MEMPKNFNAKEMEPLIYKSWEDGDYFKPKSRGGDKPFVVTIPPPNVTGVLHMGHALNNTIQDVLVRWHRMRGDETLWVPGTDHAGIATQNKVEQKLAAKGKTRFDLGRENFIKESWKWKEDYEKRILGQLKTMGCSCDWDHTRFTMDEGYSKAVLDTFVSYYEKGYLYRGHRIINWCPRCTTSLSDLEVEHEERHDNLWHIRYEIEGGGDITVATTRPETMLGDTAVAVNPSDRRYKALIGKTAILPILGRKLPIVGDDYVDAKFGTGAVKVTPAHDPNDYEIGERHNLEKIVVIGPDGNMTKEAGEQFAGKDRYEVREAIIRLLEEGNWLVKTEPHTHSVGHCYRCHTVIEPLLSLQWFVSMKDVVGPAITAVKNGEVKFHPSKWTKVYLDWMDNIHDWCVSRQIWWGHRIPAWYIEIPRYEDKQKLLKGLAEVKAYSSNSSVLPRTGREYRYLLSEEDTTWLREEMKEKSEYDCVEFFDGKTRFRIDGNNGTYTITDKVSKISGVVVKHGLAGEVNGVTACLEHKLTAGYSQFEAEFTGAVPQRFKDRSVIKSTDLVEKYNQDSEGLSIYVGKKAPKGDGWKQDPDVLDTWFSSALWPFATLGWPDKTKDMEKYYPTTFLSTARDIIYLWVARMIFSGIDLVGKIPFNDVYIHATVFNSEGKRMSKSLGTGVDPLDLINKYGTDATRFGILWQVAQGQDMKFSEDALLMSQRFVNKVWNASKFVKLNLEDYKIVSRETIEKHLTKEDKDILAKLDKTAKEINRYLNKYDFQHAVELFYEFFWHEFCDKCIEDTKVRIRDNAESKIAAQHTLHTALTTSLRLLHPFMPFVTESIWSTLDQKEPLIISEWPTK